MKFNSHYDRIKQSPEIGSGEILVERAGYIPAKKRIENIMKAGERLKASRMEYFDYPEGEEDDGEIVLMRSKNFDLTDATQLTMQLEERNRQRVADYAEKQRQAAVKAAAKAAEKVEEKAVQTEKSV